MDSQCQVTALLQEGNCAGLWPGQQALFLGCPKCHAASIYYSNLLCLLFPQGDIGVAVSRDGGLTFKHLGLALDEPWHLSYPFVFEHGGQMYMVPEGSKSGALRLYKATKFPLDWAQEQVLIPEPLVDPSLVPPALSKAAGGGDRWYLFASNPKRRSSKGCRELELWWVMGDGRAMQRLHVPCQCSS